MINSNPESGESISEKIRYWLQRKQHERLQNTPTQLPTLEERDLEWMLAHFERIKPNESQNSLM